VAPAEETPWRGFSFVVDFSANVIQLAVAMSALFRIIQRIEARLRPAAVVATANTTVTRDQAWNEVVVSNKAATGAVTFALPAAERGMRVTAIVQAAQELRLDPNGTETAALANGVQQTAGKYIVADAIGETISLVCLTPGTWDVENHNGTWTAQA
jgi:hypothetical protein